MKKSSLTKAEAKLLQSLEGGADIYDYGMAGKLRNLERKTGDKYVDIGEARMYRGDGTDRMPYFGAITTKLGLKEAKRVLEGK